MRRDGRSREGLLDIVARMQERTRTESGRMESGGSLRGRAGGGGGVAADDTVDAG